MQASAGRCPPLAKEFKVVNERIVNLDDEMKEIADKAVGIDKKFDDFSEMQREMPSDAAVRDGRVRLGSPDLYTCGSQLAARGHRAFTNLSAARVWG